MVSEWKNQVVPHWLATCMCCATATAYPPLGVRCELKLPRFRGHRHICVGGVHDVEVKTSLRP
jgi:hypothetical protein